MKKEKVFVVMTCYNRQEKTKKCIESLYYGNHDIEWTFIVVDDNSTDNSIERLEELKSELVYAKFQIIQGTGNLYWNGGMRKGIEYLLENHTDGKTLLVNDDVVFKENTVIRMLEMLERDSQVHVIVGTICNSQEEAIYGGIHFTHKHFVKYELLKINDTRSCDTFNANCVLMPIEIMSKIGNLDKRYTHCLGDFDYGLKIRDCGYKMNKTDFFAGECSQNLKTNTWHDSRLTRGERITLKESPKGLPFKEWWVFTYTHFGLFAAVYHSLTPYVRILFRQ